MSSLPILPDSSGCFGLYIERVDPKKCQQIKRIAEDWQILAQKKITSLSESVDAYARLMASSIVARSIAFECYMMNSTLGFVSELQKEIYVCKDKVDRVQGIALVTKKMETLRVDYIMTNPANIQCNVKELEQTRVEGTGRAFCLFLEKEAAKEGIELVYLNALPPSIPFYLKFGFTRASSGKLVKSLGSKL